MESIEHQIQYCYEILEKYGLQDMEDKFKEEMVRAGYLIAMLDGEMDKAEFTTLNVMFDTQYRPETLRQRFFQYPESRDFFLNKVPETIKRICEEEKKANFGIQATLADARHIYQTFKQAGAILITCNGNRMKYQVVGLERYLRGIIRYIMFVENRLDDEAKIFAPQNNKEGLATMQQGQQMQLARLLSELDAMVGLESVKREIHDLVNLMRVKMIRREHGLEAPSVSMHLVFAGNPGTGKTVMARKLAEIYQCIGILETGVLVETDRSGMVAGYMGQTAELVRQKVEQAQGGILFIDEAYTLSNSGREGDYGQEAIDTLLKLMEDKRDEFAVIVAGYPREMEAFLNSNPGLRSRFNKYIYFEDYSANELYDIFLQMCAQNDYRLQSHLEEKMLYIIEKMIAKQGKKFANARTIRNFFERVVTNQANRVVTVNPSNVEELLTITEQDLNLGGSYE